MDKKNKKELNKFILEHPTMGRMLLVEGEDGTTTKIHALKPEKESVYTLNACWWDLDQIDKEIKEHEEEISNAVNTGTFRGAVTKLEESLGYIKEFGGEIEMQCTPLINSALQIIKANLL